MLNIKYIIHGSILNNIYEQDFSMLYNVLNNTTHIWHTSFNSFIHNHNATNKNIWSFVQN
jgi:hypothetical protein